MTVTHPSTSPHPLLSTTARNEEVSRASSVMRNSFLVFAQLLLAWCVVFGCVCIYTYVLLWGLSCVPDPAASSGFDHLIVLIKALRLIQLLKEGQAKTAGRAPFLWDQGQTPPKIRTRRFSCAIRMQSYLVLVLVSSKAVIRTHKEAQLIIFTNTAC